MALPQLAYLMSGQPGLLTTTGAFLSFRLGWMVQPTLGSVVFPVGVSPAFGFLVYLNFLWINFGLILPMFLFAGIGLLYLRKKADRSIAVWWFTAAAIFVLMQTMRLQPWDFDDNKLAVYFSFFAAPVIVRMFFYVYPYARAAVGTAFAIFFIITVATGALDALPRVLVPLDQLPVMFTPGDVAMAKYIDANVPQDSQILTSNTYLNPVDSLAGYPVLVGYGTWLWSDGVDPSVREADLKNFYTDPVASQYVLTRYSVRYILLDESAREQWDTIPSMLQEVSTPIYQSGGLVLYRVDNVGGS